MTDLDVREVNEAISEARRTGDWSGVDAALGDLLAQAYGLLKVGSMTDDERGELIARLEAFKARVIAGLRGEARAS